MYLVKRDYPEILSFPSFSLGFINFLKNIFRFQQETYNIVSFSGIYVWVSILEKI